MSKKRKNAKLTTGGWQMTFDWKVNPFCRKAICLKYKVRITLCWYVVCLVSLPAFYLSRSCKMLMESRIWHNKYLSLTIRHVQCASLMAATAMNTFNWDSKWEWLQAAATGGWRSDTKWSKIRKFTYVVDDDANRGNGDAQHKKHCVIEHQPGIRANPTLQSQSSCPRHQIHVFYSLVYLCIFLPPTFVAPASQYTHLLVAMVVARVQIAHRAGFDLDCCPIIISVYFIDTFVCLCCAPDDPNKFN